MISPSFRNELLEGEFKVIYESETKGVYISYFKEEDLRIAEIRSALSAKIFSVLTACGIKNHFLCSNGVLEHKIIALDVLPFKFIVHSVVNEDLSKKIFLKPGLRLDKYLIEIFLKKENEYVLLSKEHLESLSILSKEDLEFIFKQCKRIMDIVFSFFKALDTNIYSISLSFGKQYKNEGQNFDLILADELTFKNINLSFTKSLTYNLNDSYFKIARKLDI